MKGAQLSQTTKLRPEEIVGKKCEGRDRLPLLKTELPTTRNIDDR